eukprot:m.9606 g.9606  ORF g.9606 m.9606 type:complete len:148 (+) comp6964_c0_seq1:124-567(+)
MPWKPPSNPKCPVCDKTAYAAESVKITVNSQEQTIHKTCFKCIECGIKLELRNYKVSDFGDPDIFCAKCVPKQAPSQANETVETQRTTKAGALFRDVGIVNEQVRGSEETTGVGAGTDETVEMQRSRVAGALARDVGIVNEQVKHMG